MRRPQRLIAAAVLVAFAGVLGGCSSSIGSWDPTDLLDFLDTKKKLPGDRKPVFPDGVPGLEQGVPKELYKDQVEQQQQQEQAAAAAAAAAPPTPPPPAEEPKPKHAKSRGKKQPATAAAPAEAQPAEAAPEEEAPPATPPATPKKKIVRTRTPAPPPDQPVAQPAQPAQSAQSTQQPSPSPFPAPLPSGGFSR